jgi:hypothetical protein
MMRAKNQLTTGILVSVFIFASCAVSQATDLFRLFLEGQANGFYGDNIPLRTSNEIGDFGTVLLGGFFLDYTSEARYASLHYDTFAQLFTHQTELDRAGEGQFVSATDDENISRTTKLHLDEFFYRDAAATLVTTSDQAPQFNPALALLIMANEQASINQFNAILTHYWGEQWSSELSVHQTTYFATGNNGNGSDSYGQGGTVATDYHFSNRFSLGLGYRFYDFRFSAPGRPGEQAHWPFVRGSWQPTRNFYLFGMVGVVVSHTQGQGDQVNPAGLGSAQYTFRHGFVNVYGGQEPGLTSAFGNVGFIRGIRGNILYEFTPRLTGNAGASYYDSTGLGFNGKFVSWGVGVSQRVNKWLSVSTRFIQIRSDQSGSNQFLPNNTQSGQWAVGDYYIVGLAVSFEAFRWSWR